MIVLENLENSETLIAALEAEFALVQLLQSVETDSTIVLNYGHELELLQAQIHEAIHEDAYGFDFGEDDFDCDPWFDEDQVGVYVPVPYTQDNMMYQSRIDQLNALCDSLWTASVNAQKAGDEAGAEDLRTRSGAVEHDIYMIMDKQTR